MDMQTEVKTGLNLALKSTLLGCQGRGRPCKSWKESVTDDLSLWNIAPIMVHDQSKWKNALETAMKSPTRENRGKVAQSE